MKQRFICSVITAFFILSSYKGCIALWSHDRKEPLQVFPYPVSSLPPADQEALEKGIRIEDRLELARLLEDYLS